MIFIFILKYWLSLSLDFFPFTAAAPGTTVSAIILLSSPNSSIFLLTGFAQLFICFFLCADYHKWISPGRTAKEGLCVLKMH